MKPYDKFGKKIYSNTYNLLCETGLKLKKIGYKEVKNKPNLFYKRFDGDRVFADMRGTELIPIWEEPVPLVYFDFEDNIQQWEQVRKEIKEFQLLEKNNIPWRESFWKEVDIDWIDWSPDKIHWSNTYGRSDGYCKCCGKDMRNNEYFCSDGCKNLVTKKELARQINLSDEYCNICKTKKIYSKKEIKEVFDIELPDVLINHHVSYNPEKVITVCRKCHNKIHKTDEYPDLKPSTLEIRKFYNKQKPQ